MSDINIDKVVLKKEGNRYIFDPRGNIDLSNYYTKSETDSKYALTSHTHSITNITNLQSTLDGKSNTNHTHSNYATTTALNEVRNLANGKLANIDTHKFVNNTIGQMGTSNNADAYLNKNLKVRHNCLGQLSGKCDNFYQWLSITQNGYEIYRYTTGDNTSIFGFNVDTALLFTTSDIFKVTTSSDRTSLSIRAFGTDSNLYY